MHSNNELPTISFSQAIAHQWPVVLALGLLSLALAVMAMCWPLATADGLTRVLGILAVIEGVILLLASFGRHSLLPRLLTLACALLSLGLGVLTVLNPLGMASMLLLLLAAWLLVAGGYRCIAALRMLRQRAEGGGLLLLSGLLTVVLAILLAINPLLGVALAMFWLGLLALLVAVLQLGLAWRLYRLRKPARRAA